MPWVFTLPCSGYLPGESRDEVGLFAFAELRGRWSLSIVFSAMALRLGLFDFENQDYRRFLSPWYDFIVSNEGFGALAYDFSNYSLILATYLPLPKLYVIKLVSFDLLLALFVLLILRLRYENRVVWLFSFFVAWFAPTVFINSALWGQRATQPTPRCW